MEKLTMSRPSALRRLAFSATAMMALGLARPIRRANWGIAEPRTGPRNAAWEWGNPTILAPGATLAPGAGSREIRPRGSCRQEPVPLRDAVGFRGQRGIGIAFDPDRLDLVALAHRIDHVEAFDHLAEHGVLAVEPWRGDMGDEELAAVGVRAGVRHRQHATLVAHAIVGLVLEAVARAAAAAAFGAAALDHEIGDD